MALLVGLGLAAALWLPAQLRLAGILGAFGAGIALERHRQARRPRPLTLRDTPAAWWAGVLAVGLLRSAAGLAMAALAMALLVLPALRHQAAAVRAPDTRAARAPRSQPSVHTVAGRLGRPLRTAGGLYRVRLAPQAPWAAGFVKDGAGPGQRWVMVQVDVRNVGRRRFDPADLAYRLSDRTGQRYAPVVTGGTGAQSLTTRAGLRRGESAQARLGFKVPKRARGLALLFEPTKHGSRLVQVPLDRR